MTSRPPVCRTKKAPPPPHKKKEEKNSPPRTEPPTRRPPPWPPLPDPSSSATEPCPSASTARPPTRPLPLSLPLPRLRRRHYRHRWRCRRRRPLKGWGPCPTGLVPPGWQQRLRTCATHTGTDTGKHKNGGGTQRVKRLIKKSVTTIIRAGWRGSLRGRHTASHHITYRGTMPITAVVPM